MLRAFPGNHAVAEAEATRSTVQTTAAARPVLMRCRVRLAPDQMERAPRTGRASARALVVRGAVASLPAFLSGSFLATSCRPPAAPFAVLSPPVGRSRRHRSYRRFRRASSCRTRPQTLALRSGRASLHCAPGRARSLRRGCGVWRHSSAFGDLF